MPPIENLIFKIFNWIQLVIGPAKSWARGQIWREVSPWEVRVIICDRLEFFDEGYLFENVDEFNWLSGYVNKLLERQVTGIYINCNTFCIPFFHDVVSAFLYCTWKSDLEIQSQYHFDRLMKNDRIHRPTHLRFVEVVFFFYMYLFWVTRDTCFWSIWYMI